MQEEVARKARTVGKETEMTKVSSSWGSSLRSISPAGTPCDTLTKVSDGMDEREAAEKKMAHCINVPSVYPQTSVVKSVNAVLSMHGGQSSAQTRDLEPSVSPVMSTEGAVRDIKRDRAKTDGGAGSQRATAQADVKFATPKLSMPLSGDQNWLPPTFGGNLSSLFKVPHITNTQKEYLPSQGPHIADYIIRSSLSILMLAELSGDPYEWPEWSGIFLYGHAANIDTGLKMNHLKTLVTEKAKDAIAGLGYTGDRYDVAWNTLVDQFGQPQVLVNSQVRRIYSFPPIKALMLHRL